MGNNSREMVLARALCFSECNAAHCVDAGKCVAGSEGPQFGRLSQARRIINAQRDRLQRESQEWIDRNAHILSAGHLYALAQGGLYPRRGLWFWT